MFFIGRRNRTLHLVHESRLSAAFTSSYASLDVPVGARRFARNALSCNDPTVLAGARSRSFPGPALGAVVGGGRPDDEGNFEAGLGGKLRGAG